MNTAETVQSREQQHAQLKEILANLSQAIVNNQEMINVLIDKHNALVRQVRLMEKELKTNSGMPDQTYTQTSGDRKAS